MRRRVAVLNLSETQRDPRVQRIASALGESGQEVTVFGTRLEIAVPRERVGAFELIRTPVPTSFLRSDIHGLERALPEAAEIVEECAPEVWSHRGLAAMGWFIRRAGYRLRCAWAKRFQPALSLVPDHVRDIVLIRRCLLMNLQIFHEVLQWKPEVVHCNDLDTLLAGFMLKRTLDIPLIFDAHEIFPEQFAEDRRSDLWYRFYSRLEERLIHAADGRLTVCDSIGAYYRKCHGTGPFLTVLNVPSIQHLVEPSLLERRRTRLELLYHGAYFPDRGLELLISMVARLPEVHLTLRGWGPLEGPLRALARRHDVGERVRFAQPVPVGRLIAEASEADVGLSPFVPTCLNTRMALPNKQFEYMMAGLATASADLPELRRITQELDNGVLFRPGSVEELAERTRELARSPERVRELRRHSHNAARDRYHWEAIRPEMLAYHGSISA